MLQWWKYNGPPTYIAAAGYLGLIKDRPKSSKSTGSLMFPPPTGGSAETSTESSKETGNLNELVDLFRNMGGGFKVN